MIVAAGTERRRRSTLIALACAAVAFRPTGPLLAGAALLLLCLDRPRRPVATPILALTVVAATAVVVHTGARATGPPAEGTFAEQVRAGIVIEGTPEVRTAIAMPAHRSDGGLRDYIMTHPGAAVRLAVTRVVVEVAQVRRHYPSVANTLLGVTMMAFSLLTAVGLHDRRGLPLRLPTVVVLLPLIGVTAVTFASPEDRYGWAGLVAAIPAAGLGAQVLVERVGAQRSRGTAR